MLIVVLFYCNVPIVSVLSFLIKLSNYVCLCEYPELGRVSPKLSQIGRQRTERQLENKLNSISISPMYVRLSQICVS